MSHQHIEALNERWSDLQVKEVMKATSKLQTATWEDPKDVEKHLRKSLKTYQEDEMKRHKKERKQIRATVAKNLEDDGSKGGGSRIGAGNATPRAKQSSSASRANSGKRPESTRTSRQQRIAPTSSKDKRARAPTAGGMSNEDVGDVAVVGQPAARDVDLDRSRSPLQSSSHPSCHPQKKVQYKELVRRDTEAVRGSGAGLSANGTIHPVNIGRIPKRYEDQGEGLAFRRWLYG